jgi:hypothetical protein
MSRAHTGVVAHTLCDGTEGYGQASMQALDRWCAVQEPRVSRTSAVEQAIREFLERRSAHQEVLGGRQGACLYTSRLLKAQSSSKCNGICSTSPVVVHIWEAP